MLARSDSAKYAKSIFLATYNDLDIYIEDTAAESKKIFAEIFKRVLGAEVKISDVYPIGGKTNVINKCIENQGKRHRKAIFIVDGDYDFLSGEPMPKLIRFYRLKRYCIENYLIDEHSILSILDEQLHLKDFDEIRTELNFPEWKKSISVQLAPLIVASCIGLKNKCGLATINFPLDDLCTSKTGLVDGVKISLKSNEFQNATDVKKGIGTFHAEHAKIMSYAPENAEDLVLYHASGKNILLPLLKRRLYYIFKYAPESIPFKLKIAMRCDVSDFSDLPSVIQ